MGIARGLPDRVRQGPGRRRAWRCPRRAAVFIIRLRHRQAGRHAARRAHARPRLPRARDARAPRPAIRQMGIPVEQLNKIGEGSPHVVDRIRGGDVDLVINTPAGRGARADGWEIRRAAIETRHPVHHDDDRRLGGGARDRRRARRRPDGALAPGAARAAPRPAATGRDAEPAADMSGASSSSRAAAPEQGRVRWRRSAAGSAAVTANERSAPTACVAVDGPGRPGAARRASSTCWRARAGWGGESGRPHLGRAFSVCRARGGRLEFLLEAIGPGTERLARARAGRRPVARRPARHRVHASRRAGSRGAARRRRHRRRAARDLGRGARASGAPARVAARLPQRRATRAAAGLVRRRRRARDRRRHRAGRPSRPRHRPARSGSSPRRDVVYACGPPPMLEAVRRICARAGVPAQLALEAGMACGFGACFGCVVRTRTATGGCAWTGRS